MYYLPLPFVTIIRHLQSSPIFVTYLANPSSARNALESSLSRARNLTVAAWPMRRCCQKFYSSSFFQSSACVARCMACSQNAICPGVMFLGPTMTRHWPTSTL
jgi:hypothetical protein